ncbi:MAG TPA: DapH/DapD/GlmU-related protein [Candidatus Aminicenantes bacterium]|nr:DapH/DapD/GlmU-related protein [Candidatus Aminicenantes bacterium]HRY65875.1 DapH/DapD/GlmU-related protein [Candidatus Aminicenantes bacterium]HRZ72799.1 DapH/DapD/GlmU-related protein [Candidatus Aminicenantes bacterium]
MKRPTVVLFWGGERTAFQPVLGRPLGAFALEAAVRLDPDAILVLAGPERPDREDWDGLIKAVATSKPVFVLPGGAARGAGRPAGLAVLRTARPILERYPDCDVLAVPASRPLLRDRTLKALLRAHRAKGSSLTFLSAPGGAGLAGVAAFRSADVFPALRALPPDAGFEALALRLTRAGRKIGFLECPDAAEAAPAAVGPAAAELRRRKNEALARRGVVLLDAASSWIDWDVRIGPRTVIYPFVVIEGPTRIGADGRIHPHVHIVSSTLGDRVRVLSATVMEDTVLERDVQVGPFSRFRPKTRVRAGAKVGNFVEMKNTDFGPGSKAQHLSYLGDSTVGEGVNVGAGTITCNYDGVRKNPTRIEAGAFIGSGTELVAPVTVGRGAYVAAGSTITEDVAAGALAIARARQTAKPGWARERARARAAEAGRKGGKP